MKLTRRGLLAGAAAAGLGGAGVYELVDRLASAPERPAPAALPPEQHLLELAVVDHEGVPVVVPPLHHAVLTATIAPGTDLREAQQALESELRRLDERYEPSPAGLGVTVGWGLPYFERHVREQAGRHLPFDRRAAKPALLPTRRFPSDPKETILERNDLAVLLRSDRSDHVEDARRRLTSLPFLHATSVRRGFAGGGFAGETSLPKKMAVAAGVPGADLIPDSAELFLGFTSTQKAGLGPRKIANHETLGFVDVRDGYFRHGTHMHLSHIEEDLEAWYLNFDFRERVDTTFRPGLRVREGAQTVRQGPKDTANVHDVRNEFNVFGRVGHSASIQPTSRLAHDFVADDGTLYSKGTAIPQRADFNTLDNPFAWSVDGVSATPRAGVHFVVFNPSSDDFHRNRLAMDGALPDGTRLPLQPGGRSQGINSVLKTTHRQNFLVPPRRHRSFPLAEV